MSGIRAKNTKPELLMRKALHRLGFRYMLHPSGVPGRPDIVLPRYNAAIFVNGCFWHGHRCSLFKLPETRRKFWRTKIKNNRQRDMKVSRMLKADGWRYLVVWECAFRGSKQIGVAETVRRISAWIPSGRRSGEVKGKN